jgi:uncharacterized protein (TIGR02246 family)
MPTTATSIRDEIRRANAAFEAAFERGDADAIAALYTSTGVLLPTGMGSIQGAAGIAAFWAGAMKMGIARVKLETQDIEELSDTAIELGHYQLLGAEGEQLDHGKYLVVWKEQLGQWKLHQDIWNTSLPAPAQ